MKEFKDYMYVIVDKYGTPDPKTLEHTARTCKKNFLEGSSVTWEQAKVIGWRCKKVEVIIKVN